MAQSAQGSSCNTDKDSQERKRCWTFTLNNYSDKDIKNIKEVKGNYLFQEEVAPSTGTPHLQGFLEYKNPVRFSTVKKLIPKGHIEVCKNKVASIRYCVKLESSSGRIYSNFNYEKFVGTVDTEEKLCKYGNNHKKDYCGKCMLDVWFVIENKKCESVHFSCVGEHLATRFNLPS